MSKKLFKENTAYWLDKGFSEEEAKIQSLKYKGYRSKWCLNYYIHKGYSEEESKKMMEFERQNAPGSLKNRLERFGGDENLYKEWVDKNCSFSKTNMLTKMNEDEYKKIKRNFGLKLNGNRPNDIDYWLKQGYSEEEAKENVTKNAKLNSIRCVEYWLKQGYSEEDAVIQVSISQSLTSEKSFIKRYGEDIGQEKYKNHINLLKSISKRCVEYWLKLGCTEEEAIINVSNHQRELSNLGPHKIDYWLKQGYSEEEAENLRYEHVSRKFANTKFYWLDKGFSEEEAIKLVKEVQGDRGKRGAYNQRYKFKSSTERKFNNFVDDVDGKIWTSHVRDEINKKNYFPDFEFNNCFVEIFGDYWHANPNLYGPDALSIYGNTAKDIWAKDKVRIDRITEITGKPVFILWECDFKDEQKLKEKINEISKYF